MSKSKQPAPKAFQVFPGEVLMAIQGSKGAIEDLRRVIRQGDGANYLCFDQLIALPAFVEPDQPYEHPRSEERWKIKLRNTLDSEVRLNRLVEKSADNKVSLDLAFDMNFAVPLVRKDDGELNFCLLQELRFHFNDCQFNASWKISDGEGNVVTGVSTSERLFQLADIAEVKNA